MKKADKISAALNLPIVATYNLRSLMPKILSLKNDIFERSVDISFLQETWEQSDNKTHQFEIEKMLEIDGLQYISAPRPKNAKGRSYGGAAMVINTEKFSCEKLNIFVPSTLEVVWGLVKPKTPSVKYKRIIACSFYSPPNKMKNSKMADHIVSTLHMLYSKYPDSAIILGADKNKMDIKPILNCGLKLRNIVNQNTHQGKILDVIIMNTSGLYKSPLIAPPIQPDDPSTAKPSDHSVPVCIPHTDRYTRPQRNYRIIKYRPLPQSSVDRFGEWIVRETWDGIKDDISVTEQAKQFEDLINDKLQTFCPLKEMKLSSQDKLFITAELKRIDRQKNREYLKRGRTEKYLNLKKTFERKYKIASEKYLEKNLDSLRDAKPGQAFSVLKRLGAQPGDCLDGSTFSLPTHESESLSELESAERIADHFASISQEFPPLSTDCLPSRVLTKLQSPGRPPSITEYDTYCKIRAAKKPKTGIQNDLPKLLTQEFAPELALPVHRIVSNIVKSGEWPSHWKLEHVVPIAKIPMPESEDDLRPISLTPFFSKVTEHFVVMWLLEFIENKIDFRQYGGLKGNSITHYIIEFINFILSCQDSADQTAVMACMVDFSKAFNRQNHNLLVTKLSDMGVPGWLLKIVMAFLTDRKMIVKYKGQQSSVKSLPGGGPQGTILALLLFIVLINDLGFEGQQNNAGDIITSKRNMKIVNQIHLKYVDDMTLAEAVDLPQQLVSVPCSERPQPDNFHARTGHVLPMQNSKVFQQLIKTKEYADKNSMKINYRKTKVITFNPCIQTDFMPEVIIDDQELEVVDEIRLLGLIIRSDLKWISNTSNMVAKANKRLWILRRLSNLGASQIDLVDIYTKLIRSVLELAVPAWQGGLSQAEKQDIERVQKCACNIILGSEYISYRSALKTLCLESLEARRVKLTLKFGLKSEKHLKFKKWFKASSKTYNTRLEKPKYCPVRAYHTRFVKSPLSYLTRLLNLHYIVKK